LHDSAAALLPYRRKSVVLKDPTDKNLVVEQFN